MLQALESVRSLVEGLNCGAETSQFLGLVAGVESALPVDHLTVVPPLPTYVPCTEPRCAFFSGGLARSAESHWGGG